ncbi:PREDICTED: uncharacterized protein LOC105316069 [Amphimedon queenslandica]|uniref:Serpin domain-containing protein n=1 Tax=Amphimedon queenslandica TaxID=400682 RepID=A0AAN0K1H4_AMPQE|nr:PREDICTED: uncharacterized protein LOC105316069 [Amphimedon queenslandica]XP_019863377.1 PREDICTED: uncharacterized protein LOC105316069 [Amphimedon queenslandica]|eukprot:XP_019863376.1 PREDICTED: uncharacterized protein LOC105316069 [Amphimedon queenslandica]
MTCVMVAILLANRGVSSIGAWHNKMSTDSEDKFEFTLVTHYNPLQDIETKFRETIELFEKWGMSTSRMKSHTFFFNKFFQPYQREAFAKDFFASSVVSSTLQVLTPLEQWVSL